MIDPYNRQRKFLVFFGDFFLTIDQYNEVFEKIINLDFTEYLMTGLMTSINSKFNFINKFKTIINFH